MKNFWALFLLGFCVFCFSCRSGENIDYIGTWRLSLKFDNGKTDSRTFNFVGYGNYGQVLFRDIRVGNWIVTDNTVQFFAVYNENDSLYDEYYFGNREGGNSFSGTFTQTIGLNETTYTGNFSAKR